MWKYLGVYPPVTWVSDIPLSEVFVTKAHLFIYLQISLHHSFAIHLDISRFFTFFFFEDVPMVDLVGLDFVVSMED